MPDKKYITTPIYYVNDKPHIGHAYTTVAADILARYWRLEGREVLFLTGTDEHATKIPAAAKAAGKTPKEFCDGMSAEFKNAWGRLGITFDRFIRTTDADHIAAVGDILSRLRAAGHIYKGVYEGLYCSSCEKFLTETELTSDGLCPDHGRKPEKYSQENYFFRLSAFRDRLLELVEDAALPDHIEILPEERRNEIIGKLKVGLEDISISRASTGWGVAIPFDPSQTAYVWVDALINYATGAGWPSAPDKFAKWWPADCHLMAKDILWFHSVIWPAVLIGAGLKPPRRVFAHGFFTLDGAKMSKTRGNVIAPDELIERYGADAARYLLVTLFPFGVDGDFSKSELDRRYNSELANNAGNLLNRAATMSEKYFDAVVPAGAVSKPFADMLSSKIAQYRAAMDVARLHTAAAAAQAIVDEANRLVQREEPWTLFKQKDTRLDTVMRDLFAAISAAAVCLRPFMPAAAEAMWTSSGSSIGIDEGARRIFSRDMSALSAGGKTVKPPLLFPRVE
ncbi:MAG: methionine--tRNA ligase [Elusimicrobia bacterium HGW-Elusimicrobia-1]|jgi:methionyl-tRNA synthetase|nr:MAG: methionine--tRNA ligase [Elusimicrobia bacterium HGW-Elusimicrobia-1]